MNIFKSVLTPLVVIVLITTTLSSCGQQTETSKNATGKTELLSPEEFKTKLTELKEYQLIDVRTPGEVESGAIEGSINIDFNSPDFNSKIEKLDKNKPTLVYCAGGFRSAKAVKQMQTAGFSYIIDLKGGMGAWSK